MTVFLARITAGFFFGCAIFDFAMKANGGEGWHLLLVGLGFLIYASVEEGNRDRRGRA